MIARRLRRLIITLVSALVVAMVVWWSVWTLAGVAFHASIDKWIATGRAAGYTITYSDRQSFGFPHRVVLRFTNLDWKEPGGVVFHADQMDLSSLPWSREVFNARMRGHAAIAAPLDSDGHELSLAGENGEAHVVINTDGIWTLSHVKLDDAKFGRAPDRIFSAALLDVAAERSAVPPQGHDTAGLSVNAVADAVTLPDAMPAPFGPKMASLRASLRVMGAVPDFRRKDSVGIWNNNLGVVEFDKLMIDWGVLRLAAKGTLGFDDDLQPEGAFSGAVGNYSEVLSLLAGQGLIPPRQAGMLASAVKQLAKPSDAKGSIDVPITVQLGGLFLGPVRVFVFPEIEWPQAGSPAADGQSVAPMTPQP